MSPADLLAGLQAQLTDIDRREAVLAAAAEALSQDTAVQAAFHDGIEHERRRVLQLVELQRDTLTRAGISHLTLTALQRLVAEPEAVA